MADVVQFEKKKSQEPKAKEPVVWSLTMQLRLNGGRLEQLWVSDAEPPMWRAVPSIPHDQPEETAGGTDK